MILEVIFVSFNKKIALILIFLILFIIVPVSFAVEASSDDVDGGDMLEIDENSSMISYNDEDDIFSANNDYYFNASADDDNGDGSINNPYKYLTADRIMSNSNIYLADGEYRLDTFKLIEQVNIIGSGASKTVIKYDGVAFEVNHFLTLTDVTLMGMTITNYGTVNATNAIFNGGYGKTVDYYGNNFGGAIYTDDTNPDSQVNIVNSTFRDNYAVYGGAIYMGAGYLSIIDSEFIDNIAYNFGGAIACENIVNASVSKSKFIRNLALNDAGGAIYIKFAESFNAENIDIINSQATFGGAITTLYADVSLRNINASNNAATWDGGAIYHMYGAFTSTNSHFINNSARNGGALAIDNSTSLLAMSNTFADNVASGYGGAVCSILNHLERATTLHSFNTFNNNSAAFYDDVFETDFINLTIGNGNYALYKINDTIIDSLPSYYSLVENGYVTAVKDQQSSGNCWAFTALAVLESCIKKATGIELDLSEENMKNVIALFSDYGWKIETNNGGYDYMPWGYLASWLGPVFETDDYFDDKSVLSPLIDSVLHVQNILFLKRDNFTANDEIKNAIMKYGAVGTSMFFDNYYLNNKVNYYCWNSYSSNHAVTIVGWDDNYSLSNFKFGTYAGGDGAWIVKNSWGPNWGNNGYFYVSYYDESFAKTGIEACAYTIILNDTVRFDKNYQYDIAGMTDYLYSSSPKVWYKNKFTATNNEVLRGVSTYFGKLTDWTFSIYVNNVLKTTRSGTSSTGYYTFNLDEGILLSIGDTFEVVFNTTCEDLSMVPISEYISLNKLIYSENVSFISFDGETWSDLYKLSMSYSLHSYRSQVACIKAFTVLNDFNTTLSLDIEGNHNPITITATVVDQYGNMVNAGAVTFVLKDENVTVNVNHGKASITRNFPEGIYQVSAVFNGISYISSSSNASFEVSKENITLDVGISKYQNNISLTITASKSISKKVLILVNGKEYTVRLVNGRASPKLTDLENGIYEISVSLASDETYSSNVVNLSAIVDVKNTYLMVSDLTTAEHSGDSFEVILVDDDGNRLANKKIIFHLNNDRQNAFTDGEGKASIIIDLASGDYPISVNFNDEDEYYGSSNSSQIKVKETVDIILENETYQNNVMIKINLSKPITANLTLSVNGENQSVSVLNGIGEVNLIDLDNGEYNVTAYLDESYLFSSNVLNININVKSTSIVAQDMVTSDENITYAVRLIDEGGNPLKAKHIEFRLNNATYTDITDNNGTAKVNLSLKKGINAIEIMFAGDWNLFKSINSTQIIFKPIITAGIDVVNLGSSKSIEVMFSMPINESAIIFVNDENTTVRVSNGQTFLMLSNLENGLYVVSVELLGDDYTFTKTSINFTVLLKDTQIMADDFITGDFSNQNYVITLLDEDLNPLSGQSIVFLIDNRTAKFTTTDENGHAEMSINLDYGNYTIASYYVPSFDAVDVYRGCENSSKLVVKINATPVIRVSPNLKDVKIEFSFTRAINDTITISVADVKTSINITDGHGELNLTDLENGNYTVSINLNLDKYFSSHFEQDFEVNVKDSQIIVNDFETYCQSGESYTIQLVDQNGIPIKSAIVDIAIESMGNYTCQTDGNGVVLIPIKLDAGRYNVSVKFKGDATHFSSQANAGITVNSSIAFTNAQYALNSNYIILLKGNVSGKPVSITIDDVLYEVTAEEGRMTMKINLKNGFHIINVTNPFTGEMQSQSIMVVPRLTDNSNIAMYYGANQVYSLKAYDDYGKIVGAGEMLTFNIAGKNYNVKTDKNGVAFLKLNQFKAKTYTITATYNGYKVSNKITIKPTLITKNKSAKKGKTVKFTAKLLNSNGKILKGKKITFKIKNKKYTAKTNKKGIATIKIKKLKVGKYKIISKYGKLQNVNKIKIKK